MKLPQDAVSTHKATSVLCLKSASECRLRNSARLIFIRFSTFLSILLDFSEIAVYNVDKDRGAVLISSVNGVRKHPHERKHRRNREAFSEDLRLGHGETRRVLSPELRGVLSFLHYT